MDNIAKQAGQILAGKLPGRYIDRNVEPVTGFLPVFRLPGRRFHHPFTQRQDQAGFLGQGNKLHRANQFIAMPPADKGFRPEDLPAPAGHLRLIEQLELLHLNRLAQLGLQ